MTAKLTVPERLREPDEAIIAKGAHVLSEWLDDAAPLNERMYRDPAKALLRHLADELERRKP